MIFKREVKPYRIPEICNPGKGIDAVTERWKASVAIKFLINIRLQLDSIVLKNVSYISKYYPNDLSIFNYFISFSILFFYSIIIYFIILYFISSYIFYVY